MLTRVEITKFKSCENLVLDDIGGITALVGRNGAGKTNILQAIGWTARSSTQAGAIDIGPWLEMNSVALHLALPAGQFIYQMQADNRLGPNHRSIRESLEWLDPESKIATAFRRNDESIVISGSQTVQISAASAAMPALLAILPGEAPILAQLRPVHAFLRAIKYYPLDEPGRASGSGVVTETEYRQWLASHPANDDSEGSVLCRLIHMKLEEPSALEEVESLLGNSGLDLIDEIVLSPWREPSDLDPTTFYFPKFKAAGQSQGLRWDQLSLGTRRIISLLVSLIFDHSSVMLIEHPEDGIHRGLLRKLIGLLKTYSDPAQVVLASHSGVVFNSLAPNEARLVSFESGKTTLRSLSDREIELATRFLEEEGTLEDFLETIQQED